MFKKISILVLVCIIGFGLVSLFKPVPLAGTWELVDDNQNTMQVVIDESETSFSFSQTIDEQKVVFNGYVDKGSDHKGQFIASGQAESRLQGANAIANVADNFGSGECLW